MMMTADLKFMTLISLLLRCFNYMLGCFLSHDED